MKNKLKPTENYPKILWYQVSKPTPSEKEMNEIHSMYTRSCFNKLRKEHRLADESKLRAQAEIEADAMMKIYLDQPTTLKKVVVEGMKHERAARETVESNGDFLQWYDK